MTEYRMNIEQYLTVYTKVKTIKSLNLNVDYMILGVRLMVWNIRTYMGDNFKEGTSMGNTMHFPGSLWAHMCSLYIKIRMHIHVVMHAYVHCCMLTKLTR